MIQKTLIALLAATALPSFAADALGSWSRIGDVSAFGNGVLLTTASAEAGETPVGSGGAVLWFDVEGLIGAGLDADTYEGSAVATSFTAAAGTQISLSYSLSTEGFDPSFADRVYAVLDGTAVQLASVGATQQTGSFLLTANGSLQTLAFAVMDVGDAAGVTRFALTDLQVTPVPEPATLALWLAGLGAVGVAARRRRAA